jgi:hypothetical protein
MTEEHVATWAQDAAHLAGYVVVVDVPTITTKTVPVWALITSTDRAAMALCFKQSGVLGKRDAVFVDTPRHIAAHDGAVDLVRVAVFTQ